MPVDGDPWKSEAERPACRALLDTRLRGILEGSDTPDGLRKSETPPERPGISRFREDRGQDEARPCQRRILTLPPSQEETHRLKGSWAGAEHRRNVAHCASCGWEDSAMKREPRRGEGCLLPSPLRGSCFVRDPSTHSCGLHSIGAPHLPKNLAGGAHRPASRAVARCARRDLMLCPPSNPA